MQACGALQRCDAPDGQTDPGPALSTATAPGSMFLPASRPQVSCGVSSHGCATRAPFTHPMLRFANDGGPLMISPRDPAPLWQGSELPAAGRTVSAVSRTVHAAATDYDRACDVADGAALLEAGEGWVIVLQAEGEAFWLPTAPRDVIAVAIGAESNAPTSAADASALYERFAHEVWTPLGADLPVGEGGLALLHAGGWRGSDREWPHDASPAAEGASACVHIGDAITYPVPPGRYRAERYEHLQRATSQQPGEYIVLVRFTRA